MVVGFVSWFWSLAKLSKVVKHSFQVSPFSVLSKLWVLVVKSISELDWWEVVLVFSVVEFPGWLVILAVKFSKWFFFRLNRTEGTGLSTKWIVSWLMWEVISCLISALTVLWVLIIWSLRHLTLASSTERLCSSSKQRAFTRCRFVSQVCSFSLSYAIWQV